MVCFTVLILGGCPNGAGPAQDLSEAILRETFGFSVLALNLAGVNEEWTEGEITTIPWRERYDRVSAWLRGQDVRPDVIALQEVKAWIGCGGLADYETLFHLLSGLRSRLGVNYRVAYTAVAGRPEGLCGRLEGYALVYNADRLGAYRLWID
jgi:hypothetical protein